MNKKEFLAGWVLVAVASVLNVACGKAVPDVDELRPAALEGDAAAQHLMGFVYGTGHQVAEDREEAARWFRLAAAQGHASAQYNLGVLYSIGEGVRQNDEVARRWFREAAERGEANAQFELGRMASEGPHKDHEAAARWFRRAAERGHVHAQHSLGIKYKLGEGLPEDRVRAFAWIRLAIARAPRNSRRFRAMLEMSAERTRESLTGDEVDEAEDLVRRLERRIPDYEQCYWEDACPDLIGEAPAWRPLGVDERAEPEPAPAWVALEPTLAREKPDSDSAAARPVCRGERLVQAGRLYEDDWVPVYADFLGKVRRQYIRRPVLVPETALTSDERRGLELPLFRAVDETMYGARGAVLFTCPHAASHVRGCIGSGQRIHVLSTSVDGEWARVRVREGDGLYVRLNALARRPGAPDGGPAGPPFAVVDIDLRSRAFRSESVRREPRATAERIGAIVRGQQITVTGCVPHSWYRRIEIGSGPGFVTSGALQELLPPGAETRRGTR